MPTPLSETEAIRSESEPLGWNVSIFSSCLDDTYEITSLHIQQMALRTSLPKFVEFLKEFNSYCDINMCLNYTIVKLYLGRGAPKNGCFKFSKTPRTHRSF